MPSPYDKIEVKRSGNRYTLIADGIHRGFADDDRVARLLGDPVESDHLAKQVAAFTDENPYAKSAERILSDAGDPRNASTLAVLMEAQALATLALAYEQRQTRFDLFTGLENHAQQTGTV